VNRAIAVVGPTASGKTGLAVALAQKLDTEILSADSMQFYRGMEIGTAAPTEAEQAGVHHHFVGFLDPDADMAAGHYERLAREVAAGLLQQERIPILVGGSGLYISAFIDGLFDGPTRDQSIRDRLRDRAGEVGNARMLEDLRGVDPEYAALLTSENDMVRIVRALEVYETTGRAFSDWHREHQETRIPWEVTQVALRWDREVLYERINRRVEAMIVSGWVEETERLIAGGYEKDIDRLKALGYREIAAYLRGEHSLEEAVAATQQHHRRYAKRQLTWFHGDRRIHWLDCEEPVDLDALVERTLDFYIQTAEPYPNG
jgi:tRNA dimethylallyltransferase